MSHIHITEILNSISPTGLIIILDAFSLCGQHSSMPMREDITYVMSLIA